MRFHNLPYVEKEVPTALVTTDQKEAGNNKIHRLRVIHLYKADLNFMMGIKWKEALHQAEKLEVLHPGQFGSRPGRCPKTIPIMK